MVDNVAANALPLTSPLRIAVLKGGVSHEREVSLNSGRMVAAALRSKGHDVTEYDTADLGFIEALIQSPPDVVFPALHGRLGEDGTVQGLLEVLRLPYVGSGVLASSMAMAKWQSKRCYEMAAIPTAPYLVFDRARVAGKYGAAASQVLDMLGERVVVKPALEGSSLGLTIVREADQLIPAIQLAFEYDRTVLIENFIEGVEVTVGVVGNDAPEALPTIEVVAKNDFYDYESKYAPGGSEHIIPARVGDAVNETCRRLAEEAHSALGCRGISRSDFIVDGDGHVWILETNTIPGMTETSLVPDMARARGIEYPELCEWLVALALEDVVGDPSEIK